MHYWKECCMLKQCTFCKQVVEIAMLNEHWLTECTSQRKMKVCPRCNEAKHEREYDEHVKSKGCTPAKPPQEANRCPLCHKDIAPGDEGWKKHLKTKECSGNTRQPTGTLGAPPSAALVRVKSPRPRAGDSAAKPQPAPPSSSPVKPKSGIPRPVFGARAGKK